MPITVVAGKLSVSDPIGVKYSGVFLGYHIRPVEFSNKLKRLVLYLTFSSFVFFLKDRFCPYRPLF